MMKRTNITLWLAAATLAALGVFHVKFEVQDLSKDLSRIDQDILAHQEAIHVLEAEWSYLTRPSRIERLAREYLKMEPMPPEQIASFDDLPWRGDSAPAQTSPQGLPQSALKPFLASAETRQ